MAHFTAYCRVYPFFSFKVPALLALRRQRAETEEERKFAVGIVHFEHGVLDTRMQGLSEEEATVIHEAVKRRNSRPIYGVDIIEPGMEITGKVPDGQFPCPKCKQGFESAVGLSNHLVAEHSGKQQRKAA